MGRSSTRWRIPLAAWLPIGLAFAAEATANALRAYGLGSHLSQFTATVHGHSVSIAGAVTVLAAFACSLSQTRAAWVAIKPGDTRQRVLGGVLAAFLLAISVAAMATHMLAAMRAMSGDELHDQTSSQRAADLYSAAAADYKQVKDAAPVASIEAEMAAAKLKVDVNILRRSKDCAELTKQVWRDECAPVSALLKPLADARRKADLELKLPSLEAKADQTKAVDQPSEIEINLGTFWAWAIAFGIVLIATAGPALFATVELAEHVLGIQVSVTEQKSDPPKSAPNPPKKRGRKSRTNVVQFSDVFRAHNGRAPSGKEVKAKFPDLPKSTAYDYSKRAKA